MVPVETFADVVSFLAFYDLGGLKLANKLLSVVAQQCADAIRLFDFSDLEFFIGDSCIDVYQRDSAPYSPYSWRWQQTARVCRLQLSDEKKLAEFISEAFPNCTVGRLRVVTCRQSVLSAIRAVANTITVADLQVIHVFNFFVRHHIDFIDSFRRVEKLTALTFVRVTDDVVESLKTFCQHRRIPLEIR